MYNDYKRRKEEKRRRQVAELARTNPYYAYEQLKQFPDPIISKNRNWEQHLARELRI
jgi:hypothetical protein